MMEMRCEEWPGVGGGMNGRHWACSAQRKKGEESGAYAIRRDGLKSGVSGPGGAVMALVNRKSKLTIPTGL